MMMSVWSWDPDYVREGESVGLCVQPSGMEVINASCWLFSRDYEGVYSSAKSLLIDAKYIAPDARLEDMT